MAIVFVTFAENVVSLGAAANTDSPFGSKVRKGMFRTVGQLYKVSVSKLFFGIISMLILT